MARSRTRARAISDKFCDSGPAAVFLTVFLPTIKNPTATASPSNGYANQNGLLPSAPFGFGEATTPQSVISMMKNAGNGAARPVIIQQNGVDHVINAFNQGGVVYFIGAQMGAIVTLQPNVLVRLGNAP